MWLVSKCVVGQGKVCPSRLLHFQGRKRRKSAFSNKHKCSFLSTGVIVSVGGQIPNNLAVPLHAQGVRILGTQPASIDNAEDRFRFSKLLDTLKINQPRWQELTTMSDSLKFARTVGFPVLVRPSYVLSGNNFTSPAL